MQIKHEIFIVRSVAGEAKVYFRPPMEYEQDFWSNGQFKEQEILEDVYKRYHGGTFIDVGSAIGNHTLFYAMFCQADHVISIEPMLSSVEHQIENLRLNNIHNVSVLNVAISNFRGTCSMKRYGRTIGQVRTAQGHSTLVMTLDDLLGSFEPITLIKIDTEGHEKQILYGGEGMLREYRPVIYLETHTGRAEKNTMLEFLEQFGYVQTASWGRQCRLEAK